MANDSATDELRVIGGPIVTPSKAQSPDSFTTLPLYTATWMA